MPDLAVQRQLADWIDANVIAENILERLEEGDVEPTVENAQKVWLDFLYTELGGGLESSVNALIGKGEIRQKGLKG